MVTKQLMLATFLTIQLPTSFADETTNDPKLQEIMNRLGQGDPKAAQDMMDYQNAKIKAQHEAINQKIEQDNKEKLVVVEKEKGAEFTTFFKEFEGKSGKWKGKFDDMVAMNYMITDCQRKVGEAESINIKAKQVAGLNMTWAQALEVCEKERAALAAGPVDGCGYSPWELLGQGTGSKYGHHAIYHFGSRSTDLTLGNHNANFEAAYCSNMPKAHVVPNDAKPYLASMQKFCGPNSIVKFKQGFSYKQKSATVTERSAMFECWRKEKKPWFKVDPK